MLKIIEKKVANKEIKKEEVYCPLCQKIKRVNKKYKRGIRCPDCDKTYMVNVPYL